MNDDTLDFLADLEQDFETMTSNDHLVPSGERKCPICEEQMGVEVEYGVQVDVCEEHGIWLDRSELRAIAKWIRSGERMSRINAVKKARRDGKLSGTMFGAWSLMFD